MLHSNRTARNRRGFTAKEWIAVVVVFTLGAVMGLWATGGLDSPQARASLQDMAQRTGVDLAPIFGTTTSPVGAELRDAVAATESDDKITSATVRQPTTEEPAVATSLRDLVDAARADDSDDEPATATPAKPQRKKLAHKTKHGQHSGKATLAYWNGINRVMTEELAMRNTPTKVTADNASGFVNSLSTANQFATRSIRELDKQGVDPEVLSLGEEIALWYDEGAALNGEAQFLLNEADPDTRRGARGKSWDQAERTHQKRCEEINRHGREVRQQMSKKYDLEFPDLE